ncbi:hypothetical protein HII36_48100 [Nonomuraea sp. NN258]|uniref:hypothetical protein n=1 Tax=Nonomuraea antri TaxID=2730852 RepID=UPI001569EB79|nr:hypothetical protein [Nonomuraea antri]NRQ39542.1 hypothetical protein [Nonomuraea antri]
MKRVRALLAACLLLVAPLVAVTATPAHADEIPTFDFIDCPDLPEGADPRFWNCNVIIITSGKFILGKFDQNITEPMKITYATGLDPVTRKTITVFGRLRAEKMLVRPGIFGDPILTAVYALPQYAGHFEVKPGPIWDMWLKVRIMNPALGPNCRLGKDSDAIKLSLILGTTNPPPPNTPISGKPAELVSTNPPIQKATIVDNSFAVPGANGCGLNFGLLNAVVNSQAGTPAAAGRNTAIFNQFGSFKRYTEIVS